MKSLKLHHSKRWWLTAGIGATLAVGVVAYLLYSLLSWQAYEQRLTAWQTSTKQELTAALSLKASSDSEKTLKLTALKDTSRDIKSDRATACDPARLTGWQLVFKGARATREACGAYSEKVNKIATQLDTVVAYLQDESRALAMLQPLITLPAVVSEKDWDQTLAAWSSVRDKVGAMAVSSGFTSTKEQIITVITDIETSWGELVAAHAKKDSTDFTAAVTRLQKSYEMLPSIATAGKAQLDTQTAALQSHYDKL